MLGVSGQYLFDFVVGDLTDLIDYEDKFVFSIREFAGGILPEFTMGFISDNDKLMRLLHEGTLIKAKIGKDNDSLNDMELYCTFWDSKDLGSGFRSYIVKGFASSIDYVRSPVITSYSTKSAVEAVIECAKKSFKSIDSNITTSNDSQIWLQPNITNKSFINKTIYRADLGNSFPAIAISLDGKFIIKDLKKDLADKNYKWEFVATSNSNKNKSNQVVYIGETPISSNSGIINALVGYDYDFSSFVTETEANITAAILREKLLAITSKVGGSTTSNRKTEAGIVQSKNVHDNYQLSYNKNIYSLLNLSRVEIPVIVSGEYFNIRPLDKSYFSSPSQKQNTISHDQTSGAYYPTYVNRQIENRTLTTTVKLNRESVNEVR